MYLSNKYTEWYKNIIIAAQLRSDITCYTEKHHIVPRSFGGNNELTNIVRLTAREHFICHKLLTKMVDGHLRHKALQAYRMLAIMKNSQQERYELTSTEFERVRILGLQTGVKRSAETSAKLSAIAKNRIQSSESNQKRSAALTGRKRPRTKEHQQKLTAALQGIPAWNKGLVLTDEKYKVGGRKNKGKQPRLNAILSSETKLLMSEKAKARQKYLCPHCNKEVAGSNFFRWHGDNCKLA